MTPVLARKSHDKTPPLDPRAMRAALCEAIADATDEFPDARYFYVPPRHAQALSFDRPLVAGIRGAGKSTWWKALSRPEHRAVVARRLPGVTLTNLEVAPGFDTTTSDEYPDRYVLEKLMADRHHPAVVWRTVLVYHAGGQRSVLAGESWAERVSKVTADPESATRVLRARDEELVRAGQRQLVVFDALDRTALSWDHVLHLLRGLLEVLLECRSLRALRAKAFVRPDMLADERALQFPDASKLKAGAVELQWGREDLYGLLFQRLGNAPEQGHVFRHACVVRGGEPWSQVGGMYDLPPTLRDEDRQRQLFHALAGDWMGTDHRRGFPYTWLPSHLNDASGQVSPRSFLAAVRTAAVDTPSQDAYALFYPAIKKGVQAASRIRVDELEQDVGWLREAFKPLRGLVIPCVFGEIRQRWRRAKTLAALARGNGEQLPPRRLGQGEEGLRDDLVDLGIFSLMSDGRINMPDVYRVGFGLGRRGGVKPVR